MTRRSLTFRCCSFLRWLRDDLSCTWALVTHPWRYGRWYSPDHKARLRDVRRVWIITPSVAEVYVGLRFIEEMRSRQPHLKFVISVGDRGSHTLARREAHPDDVVTYMPLPAWFVLRRALRLVRPISCIAIMTMDGFHLLSMARRRGIPVAWVSAETSVANMKRLTRFWRRFDVQRFVEAVDVLSTNTRSDRDRLIELGFDASRILVTGPAKYDAAFPTQKSLSLARGLMERAGIGEEHLVLVGGSLAEGESEVLLDLYRGLQQQFANLVFVLAPRTIALAPGIVSECERRGLRALRRSSLQGRSQGNGHRPATPEVLIVDTIGELKGLYGSASVIFLGRSLSFFTGSNVMEPAGHAKPIVVGPRHDHFPDVFDDFLAANAIRRVSDTDELRLALTELLRDPDLRRAYGQRAFDVVTAKGGSLRRTVDFLERAWMRRVS